jgi:hypothetical protein
LGALLISLVAPGGVLTSVINKIQEWLSLHNNCSVTIEIGGDKLQVTGISSVEQKRLIDTWLARHQSHGRHDRQ